MRMDDRQLYGLFAIPRNADGSPNLRHPFDDDGLTPRGVYIRMLWMQGITDKAKQEELWKAERERRGRRSESAGREAGPSFDGGP